MQYRLEYWENKIAEKRKKTPWRIFVQEIASWYPLSLTKRDKIITKYPETERSPKVIETIEYFSQIDNNIQYGKSYDFWKNFFENFKTLFLTIPVSRVHDFRGDSENSSYADVISSSKNVYLSWNVTRGNENIFYSLWVKEDCKDVYNSVMVWDHAEIIYNSIWVIKSFQIFYSKFISSSSYIWFSSNLVWCQECIFCDNLENKSYHINNVAYSKEDYLKEKKKILEKREDFYKNFEKLPNIWKNLGSTGKTNWVFLIQCDNAENSLYGYNLKNTRNTILSWYSYWEEDIYDSIFCGMKSNAYWILCSWLQAEYIYNSFWVSGWMHNFYCYACEWSCSYCIWCIGLKNKSYCILNKEYSREEWYELAAKIFSQMEAHNILWDFFPWEMNPFYFNDTLAYLIDDSFSKTEVQNKWYMWRTDEIKIDIPKWSDVIEVKELNNFETYNEHWEWSINREILQKVVKDNAWNYYRILPSEYEFLIKYKLPLPRIHWKERIKKGFNLKK